MASWEIPQTNGGLQLKKIVYEDYPAMLPEAIQRDPKITQVIQVI